MNITHVKSFVVWENGRNFFFVKVETDSGIYGLGEGGLTWREMAASGCVDQLKALLVVQDPSRIEYLWQVMFRSGFSRQDQWLVRLSVLIDIALWDI